MTHSQVNQQATMAITRPLSGAHNVNLEPCATYALASMKADYWVVSNEEVLEKTGKPLEHWIQVLDSFDASNKKSNDVVAHLQEQGVPKYWARTLTTRHLKGLR